MGDVIRFGKKAVVRISLVPESRQTDDKQIKKEIKETLQCNWLAEIEKVTIKN